MFEFKKAKIKSHVSDKFKCKKKKIYQKHVILFLPI